MKKFIATQIWNFSEFWGIGLGRFAPIVFGMMINRKGEKIKEQQ